MMVQLRVSGIISRSTGWARKTEVELNWYERLGHKKENIYILYLGRRRLRNAQVMKIANMIIFTVVFEVA